MKIKRGDKFRVLTNMQNRACKLKLIVGSHTQNPNGTGVILLEIGNIIEFIDSNDWDKSFWTINDISGKFESLPESLIERKIIEKI